MGNHFVTHGILAVLVLHLGSWKKRFRRFRFLVPVRFVGHPKILRVQQRERPFAFFRLSFFSHKSTPNMTGRPGCRAMEMIGGSSVSYLACTPCVPLFLLCLIGSDREIHTPPPQNRRSTSRVQNWGWCVICLFLRFRQVAYHPPPPKIPPGEEGLLWGWCVDGGPL